MGRREPAVRPVRTWSDPVAAHTLRIAMIGTFGLEPRGTMGARALPLARALVGLGHAVRVVMPPWHTPEAAPRAWEEAGVALEYVAVGGAPPGVDHLRTTRRLVGRALDWRPDVVHCFKPKAYAGLAAWALRQLRRAGRYRGRLVVDEDDWEGPGGWNDLAPYPAPARALFARQERWGLRHADAVTVASRALQTLAWGLGVPPRAVHYLPNGADPPTPGDGAAVRARLGLGEAPVLLLYTRFFEFDVARPVAVLARVVRALPDARLVVVGKALYPEDEARFDRLVAEAGLGGAVAKAGWVAPERVADHLAAADVAIYPFDDTLVNRCKCPAKLAELAAAGVPVVAEAVGENREYVVHGETGALTPSGDAEAMASWCVRLLGDRDLRERLGEAARRRMREAYAWPSLAHAALAAYTGAPSDAAPAPAPSDPAAPSPGGDGSGSRCSR